MAAISLALFIMQNKWLLQGTKLDKLKLGGIMLKALFIKP